jgi:acyl-CoA synthetase (AMP-forming)/AMP-acid ligase II
VVVLEDGTDAVAASGPSDGGVDGALVDSVDYETALGFTPVDRATIERSSDDHYIFSTGGTTGAPKGVVWRSEDIFFAALAGGNPGGSPIVTPGELSDRIVAEREPWLVTSLMMHGNGQWNSLVPLLTGRGVVLWTRRRFDAATIAEIAAVESGASGRMVGKGEGGLPRFTVTPDAFVLDEVPGILKSHPGISDVVVVGVPDERFGQNVAAVVVERTGRTVDVDSLREHLRPILAGYKAPRYVCRVDEIAYTAQAKPDLSWAADIAAARLQEAPKGDLE